MKQAQRHAVLATIEDYLTFLEAPQPRQHSLEPSARVPLSVFKHAEPDDPEAPDLAALSGAQRTIYLDEDDNPARWLHRFSVAIVGPGTDENERLILQRVRLLAPQETRGRINPWTPHAAAFQVGFVGARGTYKASEKLYGYVAGKWRIVDATVDPQQRLQPEYTTIDRPDGTCGHLGTIGLCHQIAVYRPLFWHVALGYASSAASLLLPIDARAALDLFRYRALPPGAKRRAALLHWVSDHWRRKVTGPADALYVHEHLRGETYFEWSDGLWVRIMPSEEDKKRLKASARHAADAVAPR